MKRNTKRCRWNPPISLAAAKHFHLLLLALCLIFHQTSAIKSFTHLRSLKCFRSTLIIRFLDWFLNILTSSFHFIWAIYRLWMGIDPFHLFKFWAVGCTHCNPLQGQYRVEFTTQGKPCFHYREPLFSLQGPCIHHRESCIHYREFPVRITTQGNPCNHYREWVCSA